MKFVGGITIAFVALIICIVVYYFVRDFSMSFGQGHGSIKEYQYPVTKYTLSEAVDSVLKKSKTVQRDTNYYYYELYDSATQNYTVSTDPIEGATRIPAHYNDGIHYLTIHINKGTILYNYTLCYYADSAYWDTAKNSEIFIAYAYDGKGNGGSEGNGGFEGKEMIKKDITDVFEREFINKLDKQLGKLTQNQIKR